MVIPDLMLEGCRLYLLSVSPLPHLNTVRFVIYSTPEDLRLHISDACRDSDWQYEVEWQSGALDLEEEEPEVWDHIEDEVVVIGEITALVQIPAGYGIPWGAREPGQYSAERVFYALQRRAEEEAEKAAQREREALNDERQVSLIQHIQEVISEE